MLPATPTFLPTPQPNPLLHVRPYSRKSADFVFAYRYIPQESTGFSPIELLYEREVRRLLDLLRDYWENPQLGENIVGEAGGDGSICTGQHKVSPRPSDDLV